MANHTPKITELNNNRHHTMDRLSREMRSPSMADIPNSRTATCSCRYALFSSLKLLLHLGR